MAKQHPLYHITGQVMPILKHDGKGKPQAGKEPSIRGYKVDLMLAEYIMTLCLLVYNVAQYSLRKKLKDTGETLPNQLNKKVQNPTLRWIFQIMEGLSVLHFYEGAETKPVREMVTNKSALRKKISRSSDRTDRLRIAWG